MWSYPIGGNIWTADAISDLNNDGKQEVLAGNQTGMVYCFNGANGSVLWSYNAGRLIYSIRAIADISFDGKPDVLVGTQASSSNNIAKLLAICGGNYPSGINEGITTGEKSNFAFKVFPNPFNKIATVHYTVPISGNVSLKLYNATGRLVKTLIEGHINAGSYTYKFEVRSSKFEIPAGIYFLKYSTASETKELKLIVE
jgi:outer membrane protein assembly factor BamB